MPTKKWNKPFVWHIFHLCVLSYSTQTLFGEWAKFTSCRCITEDLPHFFEEELLKSAVAHYFVVIEELNLTYTLCYCLFKGYICKYFGTVTH